MIRRLKLWVGGSIFAAFSLFFPVVHAAEPVTIDPLPDTLLVKIHGEEFTVLHYGPALPKPYFWPVRGLGGAILTRPIEPGQKEHPHHRGIWLAVDEVNDIQFWAEKSPIRTREIHAKSGNPGTIEMRNEWLAADGSPTLLENTKVSIYPSRLVIYDISIAPPEGSTAIFNDTKEGFFGVRIAQSMREQEGGHVVNSEGKKTTAECWGQPAKWVDYTGIVDGQSYGVTLMDHPANFRPSRYHVRDYGLFSISPFGEGAYQNNAELAKPLILNSERPTLRMRYGLYVHQGDASLGKVSDAYDAFVDATK